ncbi:MAG: YaaA family protein, partial [Akkermansiaceae bacterium]
PYRLEMGKKITTERGSNLYHFWGEILTDSLNKELKASGDAVINLASNEYFSAVKAKNLKAPVITPVFKDWKNGKYKVISFFAKKARGTMAAWAIQKKITTPSALKRFKADGYKFDKELSDDSSWVFTRKTEG